MGYTMQKPFVFCKRTASSGIHQALGNRLRNEHRSSVIIAAIGACAVQELHCSAVLAFAERWFGGFIMRSALIAARARVAMGWIRHSSSIFLKLALCNTARLAGVHFFFAKPLIEASERCQALIERDFLAADLDAFAIGTMENFHRNRKQ